jgi:hypothetical protein
MSVLRILGWALFLVGVAVAGYEVISGLIAPEYHVVSLGELWFKISVGSLNGLQVVVQRHLGAPWLWDNVIVHALRLPAWTVFAVPGLLLLAVSHSRPRRRRSMRG